MAGYTKDQIFNLLRSRNGFLATDFISGCDDLPSFPHGGENVLRGRKGK